SLASMTALSANSISFLSHELDILTYHGCLLPTTALAHSWMQYDGSGWRKTKTGNGSSNYFYVNLQIMTGLGLLID
ncbi:hypothetical protein ACJX0J_023235, partial [Zea mays]